jgi:hypothetical protein
MTDSKYSNYQFFIPSEDDESAITYIQSKEKSLPKGGARPTIHNDAGSTYNRGGERTHHPQAQLSCSALVVGYKNSN